LLGAYASINGYDVVSVQLKAADHSYGTTWGRSRQDQTFSQIAAQIRMRGDPFSSFITWVLPLLIVMSIVLLAPSLGGAMGDVRLAIPSTALLTLIFLQQTYKSDLPLLSYLTFLDGLYAYSYIASLLLFILFVWGTNVYADAPELQKDLALVRINRIDRFFQIGAVIGFVLVGFLAWIV
jgi:hypothetical protein